jgi:hypothetical protein
VTPEPDFAFDDGRVPDCFAAYGQDARLGVVEDGGRKILAFTYTAARTALAGLTVSRLALPAETTGLIIELRPRADTSLLLELAGQDGARHQAFFFLPGGRWQTVAVPLAEFSPAEQTRCPATPAPGAVTEMRLVDVANLPGEVGLALGLKDGPQELDLASLSFARGPIAGRSRVEGDEAVVDTLEAEPLALLPIGGPRVALVPAGPGSEIEVGYRFGEYRWAGLLVGVGHLPADGMQALVLRARAEPALKLHIVLEGRDGVRREVAVLASPEDAGPVEISLERFRPVATGQPGQAEGQAPAAQPPAMGGPRVLILLADTFSTDLKPGEQGTYWVGGLTFRLRPQKGPRRLAPAGGVVGQPLRRPGTAAPQP